MYSISVRLLQALVCSQVAALDRDSQWVVDTVISAPGKLEACLEGGLAAAVWAAPGALRAWQASLVWQVSGAAVSGEDCTSGPELCARRVAQSPSPTPCSPWRGTMTRTASPACCAS